MGDKREVRFTRELVERLRYNSKGTETQIVWGTGKHRNLGIALSPAGAHTWIVRVNIKQADARRRRRRIGRLFPGFTVLERPADEAVREFEIWKGEAAQGVDPIETRRPSLSSRLEQTLENQPATVSDLLARYRVEHVERELESSARRNYGQAEGYLKQHLGSVLVAALHRAQLNAFRDSLSHIRSTFNRARKVLSHAYRLADRRGWTWGGQPMLPPGLNPAVVVEPYREGPRQTAGRAFEPEEVARIAAIALGELSGMVEAKGTGRRASRAALALPLFLFYTGMRKNEGMGLTWTNLDLAKSSGWSGWVDLARGVAHLIHHKTQRTAGPKDVPLSPEALEILDLMRGEDETWVFPGEKAGDRLRAPEHTWRRLQKQAGIAAIRGPHQTRHTFVTAALEAGASLAATGAAVGHSSAYMTSLYGHISEKAARQAAELAAGRLRPNEPTPGPPAKPAKVGSE